MMKLKNVTMMIITMMMVTMMMVMTMALIETMTVMLTAAVQIPFKVLKRSWWRYCFYCSARYIEILRKYCFGHMTIRYTLQIHVNLTYFLAPQKKTALNGVMHRFCKPVGFQTLTLPKPLLFWFLPPVIPWQ